MEKNEGYANVTGISKFSKKRMSDHLISYFHSQMINLIKGGLAIVGFISALVSFEVLGKFNVYYACSISMLFILLYTIYKYLREVPENLNMYPKKLALAIKHQTKMWEMELISHVFTQMILSVDKELGDIRSNRKLLRINKKLNENETIEIMKEQHHYFINCMKHIEQLLVGDLLPSINKADNENSLEMCLENIVLLYNQLLALEKEIKTTQVPSELKELYEYQLKWIECLQSPFRQMNQSIDSFLKVKGKFQCNMIVLAPDDLDEFLVKIRNY